MSRHLLPLLLLALSSLARGGEQEEIAAALSSEPARMTLKELRAQAVLLARHPEAAFRERCPGSRAFGGVDLPRVFAAAAAMDVSPDSEAFFDLHRVMLPDMLPALVAELPQAGPESSGHLFRLFDTTIRCTDRYRETVHRTLLWVVARRRAEEVGAPPPKMEEISVEIPEKGLPAAFRVLVEDAWETGAEWPNLQAWLRRWGRDLTPLADDLGFLAEQVRLVSWLPDRALFVRLIGRIDDPRAEEVLASTIQTRRRPTASSATSATAPRRSTGRR